MRKRILPKIFMTAAVIVSAGLALFTACDDDFWGPIGPPKNGDDGNILGSDDMPNRPGGGTTIQPGSQFNSNISYGSLYDSRDGKTYRTVVIGGKRWMAENLNYNVSGSVCYGNNSVNCDLYGRLYDWATVMDISTSYNNSTWGGSDVNRRGVCPSGWHVPSDDEWTALTDFVGSNAGTRLKSRRGWYDNGNGTDDYGFSALPGGYWWSGNFGSVGYNGCWWSATENDATVARGRYMDYINSGVYWYNYHETGRFSLRCVEDVRP